MSGRFHFYTMKLFRYNLTPLERAQRELNNAKLDYLDATAQRDYYAAVADYHTNRVEMLARYIEKEQQCSKTLG